MTGHLRIGGALFLGVLIVLFAFSVGKGRTDGGTTTSGVEVVENRPYIAASDSDEDGTPDWQEHFSAQVFEAITATPTEPTAGSYEAPTTFTAKFSEAFFQDYMQGKIRGADLADPSQFVDSAIKTIESSTRSKQYTRLDITVIPDSDAAVREYGNVIGDILEKHSTPNENEAIITERALVNNDPSSLVALDPILTTYKRYIEDTLKTPVPQSYMTEHLALLTTYEAIATDIEAMRQIFTDPLYGLARVKRYQDDATGLHLALRTLIQKLTKAGVVYAKDEPGAVLYIWSN